MGLKVGIDLGTSTSEIAVFRNGKPEFVRDIRGSRSGILPSVVAVNPVGQLIVGEAAARDPDAATEFKRFMGEEHSYTLGDREYRPEELSARVLKHLVENVQRVYAEEIDDAVISVPASFRDPQRQVTMDAAELAGLSIERVINEPTAAALAYGLGSLDSDQVVVVYDLGGGTLDVTVLEMVGGILAVSASAGDRKLGGSDFDQIVLGLLADEIEREHGISMDRSGQTDRKTYWQLKAAAERAKIDLSSADATSIDIPFVGGKNVDLHMVLSRREFELASRDLVERTRGWIDKALKDAKIRPVQVDTIILVGGSTRIPAVRELVSEYFDGRALPEQVPPDEAVAMGAAVQAALKAGVIDSREGLVVTDVTSHSLGVAVLEIQGGVAIPDRMSCIIPRQSTIPILRTERYSTVFENQSGVHVRPYQGESPDVAKNEPLSDFHLEGIPPGQAGSESIDISMGIDINGKLELAATIVSTGKTATQVIAPDARRMTEEQKQEATQHLETQWKQSAFYARVEPLLAAAGRAKRNLSGEDLARVTVIEDRLKDALADNDEEAVTKLDQELTDVLFDLQ